MSEKRAEWIKRVAQEISCPSLQSVERKAIEVLSSALPADFLEPAEPVDGNWENNKRLVGRGFGHTPKPPVAVDLGPLRALMRAMYNSQSSWADDVKAVLDVLESSTPTPPAQAVDVKKPSWDRQILDARTEANAKTTEYIQNIAKKFLSMDDMIDGYEILPIETLVDMLVKLIPDKQPDEQKVGEIPDLISIQDEDGEEYKAVTVLAEDDEMVGATTITSRDYYSMDDLKKYQMKWRPLCLTPGQVRGSWRKF